MGIKTNIIENLSIDDTEIAEKSNDLIGGNNNYFQKYLKYKNKYINYNYIKN